MWVAIALVAVFCVSLIKPGQAFRRELQRRSRWEDPSTLDVRHRPPHPPKRHPTPNTRMYPFFFFFFLYPCYNWSSDILCTAALH
jgi:hypothetical protein